MGMEPKRECCACVSVGVRGGNDAWFWDQLFDYLFFWLFTFRERRGTRGRIQFKARASRANLSSKTFSCDGEQLSSMRKYLSVYGFTEFVYRISNYR